MNFKELKEKVEELQRKADKAQGALETAEERLQEEFNCKTLKDAEILLKAMEKDAEAAKAKYEKELEEFMEEWGDVLD
jgi:hypothetical protein